MGQKVNIPSQNQPFRRQASIGGNVSFRNIGDNNDNSFIALAKVTRVYYQRGKLDFKLTNTNSLVADRSGNGSGSAPIPVDFFGRRKNGQVFGHYRPVKIGDLIAVAYVNGHKSSPIVIGVYPNSGQDYEIISPSLYLDGDDEDAGVAETALAEQKIYPSMQLEYRSGSGTIAKALNGHSFLVVDDETSVQYSKLWQNYNTVGFFHSDSDDINPLKETAGDWLLVHEDNPLSDDGDNHRTRFFVNKKGEIQIVLMDNTSSGTISVLGGSKDNGFTISQYYDLTKTKSGDLSDDVYEPDFKSATDYVSLNVGKGKQISLDAAGQTKLEVRKDGIYYNGKSLSEAIKNGEAGSITKDLQDQLTKNIKDQITSSDDWKKLQDNVDQASSEAKNAAEQAKQAGENAKEAGLSAEKAGEDAKATGDDIKKNVIYYANKYKGLHPGLHLDGGMVAITGKSYIEDSVINSAMIENGAIDNAKIAREAVGSSQIEDEAVTRAKIADAAIGSAQIGKLAVTDEKVGKLSFDHMIGATLDAGQINVINLTAKNIKAESISADKLKIGKLSEITGNAGTISKGRIQAGDDPNSGVVIDNLDADNPNKYTPAKKAFLLSEVKKLNSAAEAAIDYGEQTHTDYSAVEKAKKAMDDGLASLLGDMTTTTEFDYNKVIKLEQDLQDAINAFHSKSNSDIMAQIGTTAGKNAIYRGANDPVTMGVQPHENDMWLQILSNGTYNIRVWDGAQWINPGLADIKAVSDYLSNLSKSYYQPEEPVGGDVHDGDTWYKLTKGSDGNYTYVVYKRESGQWVQLLDSNDVTNQTTINKLNTSLSKLPQSYYSSTQPTGTDYKDGDIWYKISTNTTNNTVVYTPFKWNPNTNTWDPMLDASSSRNYVGSAPSSPLEGDFWMDNTTLKQYQNGVWKTIPTQGPQGIPGVSAKQQYIHIAYATSANGTENFSSSTFDGATYIGLLVDFNEEDSSDPTKYTWSRLRGTDGTNGKDGIPGKPGADGKTSYVHFAYANSSDGNTDFNLEYFDNALYIGTYTDFTESDSSDHTKYTWSRLKGAKGDQGIPGAKGADGKTYYTWIKYASDSSGKNISDSPTGMSYIGIAYNKESSTESSTPTDYTWTKIKGEQGIPGKPGADGKTSYFHIAYANSADGKTGFTTSPDTKISYNYMGTYTDYTQAGSTDPTNYTWVPMFDSTKKRNFTTQPTPPYALGDTWIDRGSATYFCTNARDSGAFDAKDWTMQQLTIRSLDSSVTDSLYNDNLLINTSNSSTNGQTTIYDPLEIGQSGSQGEAGPSGSTSLPGPQGPAGQSVWFYQYDRGANRLENLWSDLKPTPTTANPPKVGDTIIDLIGNVYQITNVVAGTTGQGGGTFDYGPLLTSIKGATGPAGPQGPSGANGSNGQTPQITSNGHWQIGNNVTNYSAGILDADDSTTLMDLSTNKALYNPSEKVIFHVTSVSGHGHLDVHYYHLNNLVAEKQIYYGTSEISWSWFLPADDNVGYSVVIDNYVGSKASYNNKIAINVCSNVYQFPIMGFLSSYTIDSPDNRKQVLDYMKRLHINLVQMHDWFDLHSLPLPVATNGDSTQVSNTWTDIGNRLTRKKVIEDYCNLIKDYGMKPLAYMAMNGSDTNQLVHGLTAEMFLYTDNSKSLDSVYKTLDKNNGWGKYSLYNMNWMNGPWQDYIVNQMRIVRDNMPFDGWHIDMFGDPGDKYDGNGNPITSAILAGGIHYFLNKANNLNWDIGVNSVGEYGLTDIRNSTVPKYLYTEVWDNRKTYNDLFNLVKFLTESRDSNKVKKGVIIAAYMDYNYAKSNQGKNFNDDGIILTDLVIMASGGMHLEVGEHLLDNEYFPNNNLNMSDSLKNTYLPEMYDFFTAFKEIIGQGYQVDGLATIDGGSVDSLVTGKVCGISRGNDKGYLGLSVINMQTNGDQWRDTDANRTITKPVGNVRVTLNKGVTNHNWYLFNLENLTPQELKVGADGVVNISGLNYYSFILGVPK